MAKTPRGHASGSELNFREWLQDQELQAEGGRNTSSKTGLYPLGYGGIGLYPVQDYLTHSADAFVYLTQDSRIYKGHESAPFDITHLLPSPTFSHPKPPLPEPPLPGGWKVPGKLLSPDHGDVIPGKVTSPSGHDMPGKEVRPRPTPVPGRVTPPKQSPLPK